MQTTFRERILSIDLLRGIVMVIMALDHCRDYFHYGFFSTDPTDLNTTTPILFFTRFITHYCAPTFVFLSGTSAYLYGAKKTKRELSRFLLTRGVWLIFVELFINSFLWSFDISYEYFSLQVLWAIGLSMVILAGLVFLPYNAILAMAVLVLFGHNLLDGIEVPGNNIAYIPWYILHQSASVKITENHGINFIYPVIPWTGIMALGYCLGKLYVGGFNADLRKKWLIGLGISATLLFIIIRFLNGYGDPQPWSYQRDNIFTLLSFLKLSKYPPSLDFALATLGPGLLFLSVAEKFSNLLSRFFIVFGNVPFFYYLMHMLFIHLFAMLGLILTGKDWRMMILDDSAFWGDKLSTYGYSLGAVYLIWVGLILFLYPFCRKYMLYKANHKEKWWLSYL